MYHKVLTDHYDITIEVQPDVEHDWLLSTKDVAEGYGLSESGVKKAKERYLDELEEGKHFLMVTNSHSENGNLKKLMWTKRGVVRLGFFIKTPMAHAIVRLINLYLRKLQNTIKKLPNLKQFDLKTTTLS